MSKVNAQFWGIQTWGQGEVGPLGPPRSANGHGMSFDL